MTRYCPLWNFVLALGASVWVLSSPFLFGQQVIVIEGGTVIDGTGSIPQPDIRMVIEDGKIQSIGPAGQVELPASAQVIDATGKFIIPGLIDSHVHYFGYEGELYLNHGVTTVMSLGGIPEWDQTQAAAIARGEVVGPRIFTAGNPLGSPPGAPIGMPTLGMPHWLPVNDREEAAQVVEMLLGKGVDYIKVYRGVPNAEVAKVMADITHRAGKRVVAHLGSNFDARQAAVAGIDMLAHASGVVDATIQDPEVQRQAERMDLEGARASLMQRELFADLIDLLIREEVFLETSMATNAFKGFHPLSARFLMESAVLFSDNDLLYVTDYQRRRWFRLQNFASPVDKNTQRAVEKGYENFTLFLRRFVEAGGRLLVGSDAEGLVPPGIGLHQELELVVDAGILSPLEAIQSVTRLPAQFLGRSQEFGSLEENKIADLVILNSDPLENIANTRDIFAVLKEGKRVELGYHRYLTNPIPRPWLSGSGRHPSPRIIEFPPVVSCNRPTVTVSIHGTGFLPSSFVRIDGTGQDIEFVGRSEIRTELDCSSLKIPETYSLVVVNQEPINEGDSDVSNPVRFLVIP
ncbi:MAG: amidohydrolase family protein [Acidobacteriota bacterium]